MISRRQVIGIAAAGALSASAARAKTPRARKSHIAQAAHLTIIIPAHWSHTPPLPLPGGPQAIGAEDGFFAARPAVGVPDKSTWSTLWEVTEDEVTESAVTWRGKQGVQYELESTSGAICALVISNPHPILTFGGSADHLVLMGNAEHFDEIIDSIKFGLEDVLAADLARSTTEIIHTHSFYRDHVDWDELYAHAANIESEGEIQTYLQFRVLSDLRAAGDNHSFMRNMDGLVNIATPTVNGQSPNYPTGQLVEGYGYISFPGMNIFTFDYTREYAQIAASLRNDHLSHGVDGWIIDLRNMQGGSVSPPLTALYPFLPDGKIAGFLDAHGYEMWIEKDGTTITPAAYLQDVGEVPWPEELGNPNVPVAVLTGPNTGSAGEFVQLALTSRDNLLTFGLTTAGYTTGNIGILLYNSYRLALASSAELDVHGNVYTGAIEPDVMDLDIGRGLGVSRDDLATALDWLDQQSGSSASRSYPGI